jgi:hypothetical protein
VSDSLIKLRDDIDDSTMTVVQFVLVELSGRVQKLIVFEQFFQASITLGFGEIERLME